MTPDMPTLARFRPHVGETFHLRASDGVPHPFTLREAEGLRAGADPRREREPFSLVFQGRGPLQFHQGIYRIEHGRAGDHELHCVPLAPTPDGPVLQAIIA